ncbi:MAG: fatty acid cis/trans isomerase [Nitrosomonas sp.]|nr:fatty acid cis/trans isomerase [Nitrosomonas sp.]MCW5607840.1 fatty acid cis/trans isomerase [Nitrosomonas sp.]
MRVLYPFLYLLSLIFLLSACQNSDNPSVDNTLLPLPIALPVPAEHPVSFTQEIQPILEAKCLSCHSCFDAPCQLKLETTEGLLRGAFHESVYGGARTEAMPPTRLGIDKLTTAGWRERGFYSVLQAESAQLPSLMLSMIALAKQHPFPPNSKLPDSMEIEITRKNYCVSNAEFHDYARDHPLNGMPFAVSGLTDQEYALLAGWLNQGAEVSDARITLTNGEKQAIETWESLLNQDGKRNKLVARWLYEHLFMAYLYFSELNDEPRFFELLRSSTPPGETIKPIATVNPNDDPGGPFFYRLRPITGSIVHKRRITYPLDQVKLQRIDELFFGTDWPMGELPGYSYTERANPFVTFADIPAYARYQFMLDEAEYFVRTFIHGPVCRGQIATDVIRDHFWTLFQDPESDLFVTNDSYQRQVIPLLGMPGQDDDLLAASENWLHYLGRHQDYQALRRSQYTSQQPDGASLIHVWNGGGRNKNALLTIFRHHDSASVVRGLAGDIPQTIWLMDYPLLERTYYELVVNFDVFGNVAHQLLTRLYFDLIRNGSEHNFLRLIPAGQRKTILSDWYQGSGELKFGIVYENIDDESPSAENFVTEDPKQELALRLLERFQSINAMSHDALNRCRAENCNRPDQPRWIRQADQALSSIAARPATQLTGITQLPEVTFVRVRHEQHERTVYTVLRDRAHSNVAFILGEESRYQPEKDRLTVYPGITGSYPNFIFDVPVSQIEEFVLMLGNAGEAEDFERVVETWGVRRTHPQFWEILHDITAWQKTQQPLLAGVFDINRYKNF